MLHVAQLDHITITSSDPTRSIRFYTEVLGMELTYEWQDEITMLRSGNTFVAIAHWAKGKAPADQPAIAVDHFAFRVERSTYERAPEALRAKGIPIDDESDHGICRSLYFRDPDGHLVELVCYELIGAKEKMPRGSQPAQAGKAV
jgi:catechol 2,3-dioxygenase-like lactoylglutathione lyase family enzyme